jgi:hypothetical protein
LERVATRPSRISIASFDSLPFMVATPKPAPYSTPMTAGRLSIAFPRSAFSLSKTGSPHPAGTPVANFRDAADRVPLVPHPFDEVDHAARGGGVRTAHDIGST